MASAFADLVSRASGTVTVRGAWGSYEVEPLPQALRVRHPRSATFTCGNNRLAPFGRSASASGDLLRIPSTDTGPAGYAACSTEAYVSRVRAVIQDGLSVTGSTAKSCHTR